MSCGGILSNTTKCPSTYSTSWTSTGADLEERGGPCFGGERRWRQIAQVASPLSSLIATSESGYLTIARGVQRRHVDCCRIVGPRKLLPLSTLACERTPQRSALLPLRSDTRWPACSRMHAVRHRVWR